MNNEEAINFGLEWQCEIQRREDPYSDATQFLELAIEALRNEPKRGKWIEEDKPWGGFGDRVLVLTCSECGESFIYHGNNPKFCSECGANMREADNEQ